MLDNSYKIHIIKDERLESKMEGTLIHQEIPHVPVRVGDDFVTLSHPSLLFVTWESTSTATHQRRATSRKRWQTVLPPYGKFTGSEDPPRGRCCCRWLQHWSCRDWTTVARRWPVCRPVYSTDYSRCSTLLRGWSIRRGNMTM